jgi:hypothetical protein
MKFDSFSTYICDEWQILDLMRILSQILYVLAILYPSDLNFRASEYFCIIMLMSWFCLLQYLRVFKEFRYLAKLILECIRGTLSFLAVLSIIMLGFAIAFYWRIKFKNLNSEDPTNDVRKLDSFMSVFVLAFADFGGTESYATGWDWFFFFLAVFIICIIMMNLLIGVLSEKLGEVLAIYD